MPDLRFHAATPAPAAPSAPAPSAARASGRSATREPLNTNEQSKKDDDPLNVRARIENIYSKRGFASIDPADLRGRFRWWGLYTQRKPGHRRRQDRDARAGGARRRVLHAAGPHRRRRCSTAEQLRALGEHLHRLRPRHRRHHRPAEHPVPLDPHRGRPGDLGAARGRRPGHHRGLRRLARASFLGSPVAGIAEDEIIDGTPALDEIKRRYIGDPEFSNLPRKFKTADHRPPQPRRRPRDQRRRPSSAPSTPSTAPASTSGSAAACPPTRCSPRSSASGSRSTRSPTSGRASSRSSATTATAGCARAPG